MSVPQNHYISFQKTDFNGDKCIVRIFEEKKVSFAIFNPFRKKGTPLIFEIWFQFWDKIYFYLCEKILNDLFFTSGTESKNSGTESKNSGWESKTAELSHPLFLLSVPLVKKRSSEYGGIVKQKKWAGLKAKDSVEGFNGRAVNNIAKKRKCILSN